ncbi:hypothetical protein [Actinomadura sp. GTD37]|uniref:hypothetical protein n=1 Tax=Actinomadura sp. GTD37 TaxID=1778030 RepID=UPI0035C1BC36
MNPHASYSRSFDYGPGPAGALEMDLDIDRVLDELRRSFPGLCMWWGEFSGSLWALLPDRLVEAKTGADLARQLYDILGRPRPPVADAPDVPSVRRPDGTWNVASRPPARATSTRRSRPVLGRALIAVLRMARMSAWPVPLA